MVESIINIFFPRVCPICGKIISGGEDICRQCEKNISIIREPKCQKCGKPMRGADKIYCRDCQERERAFDRGIAVFEHKGKIKESIYRFKYDNNRNNVAYYGRTAIAIYARQIREWKIDAIVPVPIHKKRERKRGYNQASVFAEELARRTGIALKKNIIIRKKNTMPQKDLNREMRTQNLKYAFAVDCGKIKEIENVLLVDDIFTTGSTAEACSRILKKAGVKHVYVLCISAGDD